MRAWLSALRRRIPLGTSADRVVSPLLAPSVRAPFLGWLYLGGALIALVSMAFPQPPNTDIPGNFAVIAGALAMAALLLKGGERLPGWVVSVALACGTVLVTLAIYFTEQREGIDSMFYVWISLYAFFFLPRAEPLLQIAIVGIAYAGVLAVKNPPSPEDQWVITMGTVTAAGLLVGFLKQRVLLLVEHVRDAGEHQRQVLETANEAFISIDESGVVTGWNREAERIFGRSRPEMLGQKLADTIIPPGYREAHNRGLERFLETGEGPVLNKRIELSALHRDGHEFPIELTISTVRTAAGFAFNAFLRDITDRRRTEAYRATQQAATEVLAQSSTVEEAVPRLLERLAGGIGWELATLWLVESDDAVQRCRTVWRSTENRAGTDFEEATREIALPIGSGLPGKVWERKAAVWVEDFPAEPLFPRAVTAGLEGFRSALGLPLLSEGEVVGTIEFFSREMKRRDEELVGMLGGVSAQIGQFIKRKQTEVETERLKDEFFGLVSHELRTPLTSIKGYAELLASGQGELDEEQASNFVEVIKRNTGRLERLVGDLLFVARVEAGGFDLRKAEFKLDELAADCVEAARPSADEKGLQLTLRVEPLERFIGDHDRLAQLLDNLISNAVKYTPPEGRVEVSVSRSDALAVLEVRDSGYGIPEEEHARLFERFYRASAATAREIQGVGLGLTIVKAIVEAHGGRIEVDSREGMGTTFRVELPFEKRPLADPEAPERSAESRQLAT
jgi:PAS domain S-box-containing protein